MKTSKFIQFYLPVATLFIAPGSVNSDPGFIQGAYYSSHDTYKLVRSDKDIRIYTRWIPVDNIRSTRQLKAVFEVDAPMKKVVQVLQDESTYLSWMGAVKTFRRLKTLNQNDWYCYIQFSVPWPLNNQDCILRYELKELLGDSGTMITFKGVPGFMKEQEGIERISHMEGAWHLTQSPNGQTHVEYYVYSKQPPKFPTWITDPIIQKNLIKTMSRLREVIVIEKR